MQDAGYSSFQDLAALSSSSCRAEKKNFIYMISLMLSTVSASCCSPRSTMATAERIWKPKISVEYHPHCGLSGHLFTAEAVGHSSKLGELLEKDGSETGKLFRSSKSGKRTWSESGGGKRAFSLLLCCVSGSVVSRKEILLEKAQSAFLDSWASWTIVLKLVNSLKLGRIPFVDVSMIDHSHGSVLLVPNICLACFALRDISDVCSLYIGWQNSPKTCSNVQFIQNELM